MFCSESPVGVIYPMAYAHYKTMPQELIDRAKQKLPEWMLQLNNEFNKIC